MNFESARATIEGIEALYMMRKGKVESEFHSSLSEFKFIKNLMGNAT